MKIKLCGALLTVLFASAPASATITWQFSGSNCAHAPAGSGITPGNIRTCNGSTGPTVQASAWANTVGSTNTSIESAYLGLYSGGLGVTNRDGATGADDYEGVSPEHAVDNEDRYDSVLFTFDSAIDLSHVTLGYMSGDSDVTVLAYTGSGTPALTGKSYASLTASYGWSLIGHYLNLGTNAPHAINAGNITSSYWLIGAYNPLVGGNQSFSSYNDSVKLLALKGDTPPLPPPQQGVPEPGTLLLAGAGLIGLLQAQRGKRSK